MTDLLSTLSIALCLLLVMPLPCSADGENATGLRSAAGGHLHRRHASAIGANTTGGDGFVNPSQQQAGEGCLQLEDLERMALESNPTLAQAEAQLRAAGGRKLQAGLYPNPFIGVTGDENSPGPVIRGGEFGGFVEQRFVTAGKLRLQRRVAEQEEVRAEAAARAQRLRVLNAVRVLYYQALGDQQLIRVRDELVRIAREAVEITGRLANVGQADQPDLLEAEIEARRAEVALAMARNGRERTWRQLAAMVGRPSLEPSPLDGDLEDIPELDLEHALQALMSESPEITMAQADAARSEWTLRRAQVEKTPDLIVRGGLRYNRELLERGGRPVGLEGFFDVGVRIPIFDRNQGNVSAARARLDRAQQEIDRVKLSLRARLAATYKEYQDSLYLVEAYRDEMLPQARRAYELYLTSFRQMAAAYPQVLIAQRNLFQLQEEYVEALVNLWRSVVGIRGRLLTGGLETPTVARAEP